MIELLNQFGSPDKVYGWLMPRIGMFEWFQIKLARKKVIVNGYDTQQVADGVWSSQENYLCSQYGGYTKLRKYGTVYFQYHGKKDPREFKTLEELFLPKVDDPRDQHIWYIGQTTGGSYDSDKLKYKSNNHKRMRDHKNHIVNPDGCQTDGEKEKYKLANGVIPTWSGIITAPKGTKNIVPWALELEQGFLSFFQSITGYPPLMNLDQSNGGKVILDSISNEKMKELDDIITLEEHFG